MLRTRLLCSAVANVALVLGGSATAWAQTVEPAPRALRTALVSFQADESDAVLESDATKTGKTSPWYVVCEAPCEKKVLANGNFRVSGPGYYPSRQFVFPDGRERVVVTGEMKSASVAFPLALCIVGYGLFAVVAPTLLVIGLFQEEQSRDGKGLLAAGAVTAITGAVVGTTGLVLLIVHAENKESRAYVAKKLEKRLKLPGGLALDPRGVVF